MDNMAYRAVFIENVVTAEGKAIEYPWAYPKHFANLESAIDILDKMMSKSITSNRGDIALSFHGEYPNALYNSILYKENNVVGSAGIHKILVADDYIEYRSHQLTPIGDGIRISSMGVSRGLASSVEEAMMVVDAFIAIAMQ